MKRTLVAKKSLSYKSRRMQVGDEFEASHRDARILTAAGKARFSDAARPAPPRGRKPSPKPRTPEPEPEPEPEPAEPQTVPAAVANADEPDDLARLTNAELKAIARREGVTLSGREAKSDLVDKIEAARKNGSDT